MLWTILLFIITISILVTIHEFGHYWVARRCGIKVERFSIGFGPILFSFSTANGTQFVISAIPLGGYVKMLDSRVDTLSEEEQPFAFDQQTISKRAAVISAGPFANFVLAFFVYWIIFQLGVISYPPKIAQILPNSPAASTNISSGSELKSIAGIKVEGWRDVQLALVGEIGQKTLAIEYLPAGQTTTITEYLDIGSWRVDLDKESPITSLGLEPLSPKVLPVLQKVMPDSAAKRAGLEAGDKIIRYNNIEFKDWDTFAALIKQGKPIDLVIEREQKTISIHLVPAIRTIKNEVSGNSHEEGFAGIVPESEVKILKYNVFSAISKGFVQTGSSAKTVVKSFYQLLTGALSLNNLSGPIAIAKNAEQSASYGIVPYLHFLAFISVSLGVINLVPLPMLDGGHLLFLFIEKIKGSPLAENTQAIFYRLGLVMLLMLMGVALFNDFSRL